MEIKEEHANTTYKLLCNACLCIGRGLHQITDGNQLKYYSDILDEIPFGSLTSKCPTLCWECIALLDKCVRFKEQIKDSYRILYMDENITKCLESDLSRPPRLETHRTVSISISPLHSVDEEPYVPMVYVKDEIKIDWDKDDNETPLDECRISECSDNIKGLETELNTIIDTIVKQKKRKKRGSKLKRTNRVIKSLQAQKKTKLKKDIDQKIITIELTYEDMLLERQKEATKDVYVKAEFKCDTCLIGFHYEKTYQAHMTAKHSPEIGDYSCPICNTIISSVDSFTTHYKRHMKRYECSICHKRTIDLKVMQQHYYSRHEISLKQYTCNLCGNISNSIDTHRYHKDTHKARVQCPDCEKTFRHRAGLMNHRLSVHELQNEFPCTICDKVFRWKSSLKRHLEKHNAKGKVSAASPYCSLCEVTFASISSYQRHLKNSLKHVSQDQLKFICDHCNRRFADKTKLRDHIEEKHLHKTYQCHICLKPSKNRVGLDQHIRNVHKGRPNNKMCHHCGKGFPTKLQLESHIRSHTGERPFICEFCPATFSQQSNLYKHNRQVHLNVKSKRYPCKKRKDEREQNDPQPVDPNQTQSLNDPYRPVAVFHYSPERGFVM